MTRSHSDRMSMRDRLWIAKLWLSRLRDEARKVLRRPPHGLTWWEHNGYRFDRVTRFINREQQCCGAKKPRHKFGCNRS